MSTIINFIGFLFVCVAAVIFVSLLFKFIIWILSVFAGFGWIILYCFFVYVINLINHFAYKEQLDKEFNSRGEWFVYYLTLLFAPILFPFILLERVFKKRFITGFLVGLSVWFDSNVFKEG